MVTHMDETKDMLLTCRTPGCENNGYVVALTVPVDVEVFVCGVCGEPIADVAE
jgi:hypothetical protein